MVHRITALCIFVPGCAGSSQDSGDERFFPQPVLQHFAGSSEWLNPEGEQVLEPGQVWLRRELRAADSLVLEDLVSLESSGAISVYRIEVLVEGDEFAGSFSDENGTLAITGELTGEPWDWTEWSSTSRYTDGSLEGYYFKTQASLSGNDLVQDKRIYDADDVYILNIVETMPAVEESSWIAGVEAIGVDLEESGDR
jgi:hypothetical protein